MVDQLGISRDDYLEIIRQIHELPRTRDITCKKCEEPFAYLTLDIYAVCPKCSQQTKVRSFGAYMEPQDIIAAVLAWLGDGPSFDELVTRRNEFFDRDVLGESHDDA